MWGEGTTGMGTGLILSGRTGQSERAGKYFSILLNDFFIYK